MNSHREGNVGDAIVDESRRSSKPSSVRSRRERMVIYLRRQSPAACSSLPAVQAVRAGPHRLFGLAPTGGYRATAVTSRAVGSYPAVSPLPVFRAVCFLWPYPSPCDAQALPGNLPCGARTFLDPPCPTCRDQQHSAKLLSGTKIAVPDPWF